MSKLNGQAKEVLDACLSAEFAEVRAKVYQIIDVSGLEPSDPMFLILALTGQMRVLLEAAPADLSKLLTDWTEQASSRLQSIQRAIERLSVNFYVFYVELLDTGVIKKGKLFQGILIWNPRKSTRKIVYLGDYLRKMPGYSGYFTCLSLLLLGFYYQIV